MITAKSQGVIYRLHQTTGRVFACFLIGLTLLSGSPAADEDNDLKAQQQKLETVRNQIQSLQKELEHKIGRHSQLERQLGEIEKQLNAKHRELRKLQSELRAGQQKLDTLHGHRTRLYNELETQQSHLTAQLKTAYFIGNQEQLKLLLSQQDPSALARALKYFEYLNRARLQAISASRDTLREIETTQVDIERQNGQLAALTRARQHEYLEIETLRGKRQNVLADLKNQIQSNKSSVVSLKHSETQIRELIAGLTGIFSDIPPETSGLTFFEQKGLLPWPVLGNHQNRFGESQSGSDLHWQGVKIAAPAGQEVRSISHGRVAFADWIPALGLILLIDHGDGYMSLYAHNQSLYKETGDWVQAGEVVANVGNSGGGQTDSLYFEIRHNGKPLNPAEWCKKGSLNRNT